MIFSKFYIVDTEKIKGEECCYQKIPVIIDFFDMNDNDCMKQVIQNNYNQIKENVKHIIKDKLERISNNKNLNQ